MTIELGKPSILALGREASRDFDPRAVVEHDQDRRRRVGLRGSKLDAQDLGRREPQALLPALEAVELEIVTASELRELETARVGELERFAGFSL